MGGFPCGMTLHHEEAVEAVAGWSVDLHVLNLGVAVDPSRGY